MFRKTKYVLPFFNDFDLINVVICKLCIMKSSYIYNYAFNTIFSIK